MSPLCNWSYLYAFVRCSVVLEDDGFSSDSGSDDDDRHGSGSGDDSDASGKGAAAAAASGAGFVSDTALVGADGKGRGWVHAGDDGDDVDDDEGDGGGGDDGGGGGGNDGDAASVAAKLASVQGRSIGGRHAHAHCWRLLLICGKRMGACVLSRVCSHLALTRQYA